MCKVNGCERESLYKKQDVCQMHYFRYMRNGIYETTLSRKYRVQNPAGYQRIYKPNHCLAASDGYVYEHRYVYFEEISRDIDKCAICGDAVSWDDCHIDHIDEDVKNNDKKNLRVLCRGCNVFRGHTAKSMGKFFLTIDGVTMTPTAWARQPGVEVSGSTIRRRKKDGFSDFDAVYGEKMTNKTRPSKTKRLKNDAVRGIGL